MNDPHTNWGITPEHKRGTTNSAPSPEAVEAALHYILSGCLTPEYDAARHCLTALHYATGDLSPKDTAARILAAEVRRLTAQGHAAQEQALTQTLSSVLEPIVEHVVQKGIDGGFIAAPGAAQEQPAPTENAREWAEELWRQWCAGKIKNILDGLIFPLADRADAAESDLKEIGDKGIQYHLECVELRAQIAAAQAEAAWFRLVMDDMRMNWRDLRDNCYEEPKNPFRPSHDPKTMPLVHDEAESFGKQLKTPAVITQVYDLQCNQCQALSPTPDWFKGGWTPVCPKCGKECVCNAGIAKA